MLRIVLAIALASIDAKASAEVCKAEIALEGDTATVEKVHDLLRKRGAVDGETREQCGLVRARVTSDRDQIVVEVTDARGREVRREVRGAEMAAVIIESWAASLLVPNDPAAELQQPAEAQQPAVAQQPAEAHQLAQAIESRSPLTAPAPARLAEPVRSTATERDLMLSLGAETSIGGDGSLWAGGQMSACLYFGPMCGGLSARINTELRPRSNAERDGDRVGGDVSLMIEAPLSAGTVHIHPGLDAGLGLVHNVFDSPTHEVIFNSIGPRAGAHLTVSFPVGSSASIDFAFAFAISPSAAAKAHEVDDATIPGEPSFFLRALVGAQFGVP